MNSKHYPPQSTLMNWAMLAVNYDDVEWIPFPVLSQPKLNGVRAKWDHEHRLLISRQGKVIPEHVLPHIYHELSLLFPSVSLDMELYNHKLPFQDICARISVNRKSTHEDAKSVQAWVFDVISAEPFEKRWHCIPSVLFRVPYTIHTRQTDIDITLVSAVNNGFEGLMLRLPGCPYMPNRTEALIKLKPWQFTFGKITGFTQGKGKYKNVLGALVVTLINGKTLKVSGGLDDMQRQIIWADKNTYLNRHVTIKCRETSKQGIPLQPQLKSFV